MEVVGAGIVVASLLNGLRHGFDFDHIAAIGDIVSAHVDRRRALFLASVYALGHAAIVFVLGIGAIALGARIPPGVDAAMSKVVGATLVALGVYVLLSVVRNRSAARLRSRWEVASELVHWLKGDHQAREVVIEHEHEHAHDSMHLHMHDHEGDGPRGVGRVVVAARTHLHTHQHAALMPPDPLPAYGPAATFGIGVLHGVGAETPTQVLLFLTAAGVGTLVLGISVLSAFVVGLLVSNAVIALAFTFGVRGGGKAPLLYSSLALATAIFSLVVGLSYLLG